MGYLKDNDLRKSYIIKEYDEDVYDDLVALKFEGFDDKCINYDPDLNKIIQVKEVTNVENNADNYIISLKN